MESKWMSTTAGILCIIAGALGIIGVLIVLLIATVMGVANTLIPDVDIPKWVAPLIGAIAVPRLCLDILSLVGGVYAVKHRKWGVALAGGIAALFSFFFFGVASLVFLIVGKKEFS